MGNGSAVLDRECVILTVECDEPEGKIDRDIVQIQLGSEKLNWLYERVKQFDIVFNDHVPNTLEGFASLFVIPNGKDRIASNGLIWQVDDVGILYLTDIRSEFSALAHFTFWDRRIRGREQLIRSMLRYVFDRYAFHRIETRVALYANPILGAVERMGFVKEGRAREAVKKHGEWFDVNLYSILESEV